MLLVGGCDFNNLSTSINRVVDDNKDKLIIHYIDQRTTNMIPIICRTFERNPLILGNI